MYLGEERRAYARAETLLPIVYYDGNRFLKEFVRDISAGGVMIESSAACDVGTILEMAIDFNNPTVRANGTVAWMKKDGESYRLGVQLKEMNASAADEWAYFLNHLLGLTP